MPDEENVQLSFELRNEISGALNKIEDDLEDVERQFVSTGAAARTSGHQMAEGVEEAEAATDQLGSTSRRATPEVDAFGESVKRSGKKAEESGNKYSALGGKLDKTSKKFKGFGPMLSMFKWGAMISGGFAAVGMLSALGAGAVIAASKVAGPLMGALAGVIPLLVAGKLAMLGWKLAAESLKPEIEGLKTTFAGVGPAFANAGLKQALGAARTELAPLAKMAETGFAGIGYEVGQGARAGFDVAKSGQFLSLWGGIFEGIRPIVRNLGMSLIDVAGGASYLFSAMLPIGQEMADILRQGAGWFAEWAARVTTSGQATRWLTDQWHGFLYAVGVVVDYVKGLINIFKIAAGVSTGFKQSIHDNAAAFLAWTRSLEGQNSIREWFTQAIPVIRETFLLIGAILRIFGGMAGAADSGLAPLLAQIRTELLPALQAALANLTGAGGLLPAIVDLATAFLTLFAAIDPSGLVLIVQGLAGIANAITWVIQNVPGMGFLISALVTLAVVGGAAFKVIGLGFSAFGWMSAAVGGVGKLTGAQKAFGATARWAQGIWRGWGGLSGVMTGVATGTRALGAALLTVGKGIGAAFRAVGTGIMFVGRALMVAIMSNPIIAAIVIIIGLLVLLWFKCEWFRNAVKAVLDFIARVAVNVWNGIVQGAKDMWTGLVAAWNWLKTAWQATVDFIVMVAMWIWDHGLKQVVSLIWNYWKFLFNVVVFIVKVAIYIVVGIISLIAIIIKWVVDQGIAAFAAIGAFIAWVWRGIVAVAIWCWQTVILPVIQFVVGVIRAIWSGIVAFFSMIWAGIVGQATAAWYGYILPAIQFVAGIIRTVWTAIRDFFVMIWAGIVGQATAAWYGYILPAIQFVANLIRTIWNGIVAFFAWVWGGISAGAQWLSGVLTSIWNGIVGFLRPIFEGIGRAGSAAFDFIRSTAERVGGIVRGVWDGVVGVIKGAYNTLAGGWNSIPDITVPSFVPVIGGSTFSLPKLPTMETGGRIAWSTALVGEAGPEALVRNGQVVDMLGMNGPEIRHDLPKGGYVVPGLDTLSRMPGLARSIPGSVASAVSRSVPGYSDILGRSTTPEVSVSSERDRSAARRERALLGAIDRLADSLASDRRASSGGARPAAGSTFHEQRARYSY